MSPSTSLFPAQAAKIARPLRTLYFVRAAFSLVWAGLLLAHSALLTPLLLLLYPTWDVAATFADLRASRQAGYRSAEEATWPRYLNIVIGLTTTVGVAIALQRGTPAVLLVFGAWAILTGLIQLALGLFQRQTLGGQWPMILSGGQSAIAGTTFMLLAHTPSLGIVNLAGYAIFGAFYFLLAARQLRSRRSAE
jgi:uncharacterized membrane protein HdeD (DUF308 family)